MAANRKLEEASLARSFYTCGGPEAGSYLWGVARHHGAGSPFMGPDFISVLIASSTS